MSYHTRYCIYNNTSIDELIAIGEELGASHVVIEKSDTNRKGLTNTINNMIECENKYYQIVRTNNEQ